WRAGAHLRAVDDVSFAVEDGETLCLVGESGCGKPTAGELIARLIDPPGGRIWLGDVEIPDLGEGEMRPHRRQIQMVFQDPYSSLNPRLNAGEIVGEPLENYALARGREKEERVAALLEKVG